MNRMLLPHRLRHRLRVPYHLALLIATGLLAWAFMSQLSTGLNAVQGIASHSAPALPTDRAELRFMLPSLLPNRDDWSDGR